MRSSTRFGTCEESRRSWTGGPRAFRSLFNHDTYSFGPLFQEASEESVFRRSALIGAEACGAGCLFSTRCCARRASGSAAEEMRFFSLAAGVSAEAGQSFLAFAAAARSRARLDLHTGGATGLNPRRSFERPKSVFSSFGQYEPANQRASDMPSTDVLCGPCSNQNGLIKLVGLTRTAHFE